MDGHPQNKTNVCESILMGTDNWIIDEINEGRRRDTSSLWTISVNRGCMNGEIENHHLANTTVTIGADRYHWCILQLGGEIMMLNRVFLLPHCVSPQDVH